MKINGPDDYLVGHEDEAVAYIFNNAFSPADKSVGRAPAQESWANGAGPDEWPTPEDLGAELPPVPEFDLDLLPISLRSMVEDVAERMQVPPDFPAVTAIAALAGVCGRRALIQPKEKDSSWIVVPNLWGGLVGPPAMMKSPTIGCITAPAHAIEAEWRVGYESEVADAKASKQIAEMRTEAWRRKSMADLKKDMEADLSDEPDTSVPEPVRKRLVTTDPTVEALHLMLRDNAAGIFVVRDELTGWLAGLERQGREQERTFYLSGWNGDTPHTLDRIERGSVRVPHCCISLFGGIQPSRLRCYLADALRDGPTNDGLIQRFQLLVWPDMKQDWSYQDRLPNTKAIAAAELAYTRIAKMDVDVAPIFKFTPDAQVLFVEWLTALEARLRSDDVSVFMQAHLGKFRSLMPSLALLFSLADGELDTVGLDYAKRASDCCDYLERHAIRVYSSRISPERLAAISLGRKLRKGWKRDDKEWEFSVRDVYQNDWSGLGTPDEVRAALLVLEGAGWVRPLELEGGVGRPPERYTVNPKIWSHP
jgi:putative DNA primase/helicase